MKVFYGRLSSWMNAITFAEAGEWETAMQMMPPAEKKSKNIPWFERTFMAVAFAEEGLHDEALNIMKDQRLSEDVAADVMNNLSLIGIRLTYGVVSSESIA